MRKVWLFLLTLFFVGISMAGQSTMVSAVDKGKIEITKQDKDDGTKLAEVIFFVFDSEDFIVDMIVTDATGKGIGGDLALGDYTLEEVAPPPGYLFDQTRIPVSITANGQITPITINNTKLPEIPDTAKLEIIKVDDITGERLAGAVFEIYDIYGNVVDRIVTDETGSAITRDLILGIGYYGIVEVQAPPGYDISTKPINVYLTIKDQIYQEVISNKKRQFMGRIEVTKQDKADGTKLAGAEFDVKDINGKVVGHIITDETGKARTVYLPLGNYTLVETVAPTGYDLNPTPIPVSITTNDQLVTQTVDNIKTGEAPQTGQIEITKQDKADGTKLAGAEFDVKDESGVVVDTLITDPTGTAITTDLPLGDYTLVEIVAPIGYQLDDTPILATIKTDGEIVQKTIMNSEISDTIVYFSGIEINKQDKADGTKLAGAVFEVKDATGIVVDYVVTDETGVGQTKMLPLGTYTLIETKAPNGYIIDTTPISITGSLEAEVIEITVDNIKIPSSLESGQIEITKQDKGDGTKLAGAEFDVKDGSGTVVDHVVTDETGKVRTKALPIGEYTLVETVAPAGYILDDTPIVISITTNNQVVMQIVNNTKIVDLSQNATTLNDTLPDTNQEKVSAFMVLFVLITAISIFLIRKGKNKSI